MPFTISLNTPAEWNHYLNDLSHYSNYLQDCVLPAPQYSTQSFVIFSTFHPLQLYSLSGTHVRSMVISPPDSPHFSHSPSLAFHSMNLTPVTSFGTKISEQRETQSLTNFAVIHLRQKLTTRRNSQDPNNVLSLYPAFQIHNFGVSPAFKQIGTGLQVIWRVRYLFFKSI